MGFGLDLVDSDKTKNAKEKTQSEASQPEPPSQSQENAQLYAYYQEMIKQYIKQYPNANDKLALALILGRGFRPTVSKNRDLALLDIDKILSIQHRSLDLNGRRIENMRLAADLTGLKNNLLSRGQEGIPPLNNLPAQNQGNYQIFRLIRAAQMHYLQPGRRVRNGDDSSEQDMVNNSQQRIQE